MMYYDLPKKKKQIFIVTVIMFTYGFVFYLSKTSFPEFDESTKMFLNQYGLLIIFTSGLLASSGAFWSVKVNHNKNYALEQKSNAERDIEILKSQEEQLTISFNKQIEVQESIIVTANEKLKEVENHPSVIDFSIHISAGLLALGTLMCIVGAG
ncbi:hypothetical protein [Vibrio furnissii]|uniref:hypothetical protein n=1 Tax=Vibrio furnissii TaxID=29494 RepID=UPI0013021F6D|nr:hypothetical protein [Vibrio furnissii]